MKIAGLIPAIFLNIFYPNNKKNVLLRMCTRTHGIVKFSTELK